MEGAEPDYLGKAGEWLWENREWAMRRLKDLWGWFWPRKDAGTKGRILIIGSGGVGKSTAAQFLSGQYNSLLSIPGQYEESIDIERYALDDDDRVEIVVPPGQRHRRDATWNELQAAVSSGAYRGIIITNSYGYHSLGQISYKHHRLYKETGHAGFLRAFLDACRRDELDVLRRLSPHIRANRGRCWLVTLVTKQDLWWREHSTVEDHYRAGEYGTLINEMIGHARSANLRHESLFVSLVISNFTTGNNEVLAKTVAGYDQMRQVASLRRLCETLYALKEWEESDEHRP